MTKKVTRNSVKSDKEKHKTILMEGQKAETRAEVLAHMILRPTTQAALTVMEYNRDRELSIKTLLEDLRKQCELASNGDFVRTEALLTAQAHTLNAIFHTLARKAAHSEYLNEIEANLRLALKAQSQCRATLETLTAIKNPQSVAFVRQTNIAQGPQQVNNIVARPGDLSRPEKTENSVNKALEAHSGEWLERKTESTAGGAHPHVETLGAVHRTKDSGGQGEGFTKRK